MRFAIIAPRAGFVKRKLAGKRENDKKVRLPGVTGKTAASRQEGEGAAGKSKQGADETAGGAVAVSAEKKIPEAKEPRGKTQKGRRRREDKKGSVREIRRVTMALRFFLSKKGQAPEGACRARVRGGVTDPLRRETNIPVLKKPHTGRDGATEILSVRAVPTQGGM